MTLERDLRKATAGEVRFDRLSRALYATDASVYQIEPVGVVVPRSRDDVVRTVEIASRHGVSITARGGGTSQAGQAIGAGLIVDTSKYLTRVLDVNVEQRWVRVEPGVVLDDLNARLRPHGLRFAPDLSSASRATVGGMMANNSSGARSIVYGKTIDHVREQHVVLADGRVAHLRPLAGEALARAQLGDSIEARAYRDIPRLAARHADEIARRFPKVLRRVGGYNLDAFVDPGAPVDLTKIVVGSEGTLGIVLEATLALVPVPAARVLLAVEFAEVLDALAATPAVLAHGPAAVEVMDAFILRYTRENAALDATRRAIFSDAGGALLCIELAGNSTEELAARLEALERDLRAGWTCRTTRAIDPAAQSRIWGLREAALGLSTAMKGDAKSISFVEDTAVAPERLRDYIARFIAIIRGHGTSAGLYAHASVGCLHVRPVINLKTADGVARFEAIAHDVADLVLEFGGALSGEHGDGLVRGPFIEKMFGPELYAAFREVKRTFDPDGLFNPGKIVDSPPLASNLRFGPSYNTADPVTWFDYGAHGGLGRAVEMCSGVGACRKTLDGTMCPSYRATLEEAHSTRGRANALRQAMTGALGEAGLGDHGVYEALDLCLECRACKSECPTGVDMARFKSEFLADYWTRHGLPLRARAFAGVRRAAEWGSRTAPVSNLLARSGPGRWLAETLLGIDRRREMPVWTRRPFTARVRERLRTSPASPSSSRRSSPHSAPQASPLSAPSASPISAPSSSRPSAPSSVPLSASSSSPLSTPSSSRPSPPSSPSRPSAPSSVPLSASSSSPLSAPSSSPLAASSSSRPSPPSLPASPPSLPSAPSTVVLFVDTFTNFESPEIGLAALDVLDGAGIAARVVPHHCCGRPLLSQGLLRQARELAAANARALFEPARRGEPILFLEPSCLSAVREDAPALLRGDAQAQARVVADAACSFEEYLQRELEADRAALTLAAGPSSVLLHAHCHQRAMGLAAAARALLARIPQARVVDLDAGCCGMAGSFGYTRDHYDVSRAIGELKLLPAARAMAPGAVLVAAGTSCRHQVAHFSGVRAVHPAVLLRSLMEPR